MSVEDLTIPSGGDNTWQEWTGNSGHLRSLLQNQASTISLLMLATDTNVRYVDKGGNDTTGDGSRVKPFLTVQAAITNCAALATLTNPFVVRVSPGTYATSFKLAANVYVVGSGSGAGSYNGSPQTAVTLVAPNATNSIDASFAGATVASTGIFACGFSSAGFKADFAAVASTAPSTIILDDVQSDAPIGFVGSGFLEYATLRAVYMNSGNDLTFTNIGGSLLTNCANDFGGRVIYNQSAAIQGFHQQAGCVFGGIVTNWTSAVITNFILIQLFNAPLNDLNDGTFNSIVGNGSVVVAPGATQSLTMSNANNRLSFGTVAAGTLIGVNCAKNIVRCTPTAARTLTIDNPNSNSSSTEILIQNLGSFPIDLVFSAGTVASGSTSYVPPLSQIRIVFDFAQGAGSVLWTAQPIVQSGIATLTNGVSANLVADVTANSRIVSTIKTVSGAFGTPVCGGRVNGTRAGGGRFVITSTLPATGATVTTDQGTYDWHISNQGG